MEKIAQTLTSKISLFQNRLQSFLESDSHVKQEEQERIRHTFETSTDSALIRGLSLGLPDDHIDKAIIVFSRLAMFFETGVLLENQDGQWKAQAFFHHGITELIKNSKIKSSQDNVNYSATTQENQKSLVIKMPKIDLMTILKTDSASILRKLGLSHLDNENKKSCLLVKVTPDFSFLLFSTLPDIWLKDHIENIRRALINSFD